MLIINNNNLNLNQSDGPRRQKLYAATYLAMLACLANLMNVSTIWCDRTLVKKKNNKLKSIVVFLKCCRDMVILNAYANHQNNQYFSLVFARKKQPKFNYSAFLNRKEALILIPSYKLFININRLRSTVDCETNF